MLREIKTFGYDKKDLEGVFEKNVFHAQECIETDGEFQPTLFMITDKCLFYIMLDLEQATRTNTSPHDQVEPLVKQFMKMENKVGKIVAYQVIGEAWTIKLPMSHTKGLKIKQGDIAKMANRVEMLTSVTVKVGKRRKYRMMEIIREENSDKIMMFKEQSIENSKMFTTKFPEIPKQRDLWTGDVA